VKFTIRYADKVVGALVILAVAAVAFVVFMLGSSQRWFSRDYNFITYFDSASGLSKNMPLQYKGFTLGRLKSFDLTQDDRVEVKLVIFDTYISRVNEGSMVDLEVSPIGLGNHFLFYPGLGLEPLAEGELIPSVTSFEGQALLADGLGYIPKHDDSISLILSRVSVLLETVNNVAVELEGAFAGSEATSLGRTIGSVEKTVAGVQQMTSDIPADITRTVDTLTATMDTILEDLRPILANLQTLSADISDPDGTVAAILNAEGPVYTNLISSLNSVSGTLRNLERTTDFIPAQLPQVAAMIIELRTVLESVDKVLVSLTNNPLLKNGVPPRVETQPTGTSLRDINF
jgi:phospholipid/cholesterol/gamma-HCH transport system substrate-binding protein